MEKVKCIVCKKRLVNNGGDVLCLTCKAFRDMTTDYIQALERVGKDAGIRITLQFKLGPIKTNGKEKND